MKLAVPLSDCDMLIDSVPDDDDVGLTVNDPLSEGEYDVLQLDDSDVLGSKHS